MVDKKTEQWYKVFNPCLDDEKLRKEELESIVELSEVWLHVPGTIGRPDNLWSMNKFA